VKEALPRDEHQTTNAERGDIMRVLVISWLIFLGALCLAHAASESPLISADEALQKLIQGNQRYVSGKLEHPHQDAPRRAEMLKGQNPFAAILTCSDSRVPPEVIFDQGLGDIFIIRAAGNVVDNAGLGSIEYAVEHLNVPLVLVLGHSQCGAVDAAVKSPEAPGSIGWIVKTLQPAVDQARTQPGPVLDNAIDVNIQLVVKQLRESKPILEEFTRHGKVRIVGARYDLHTGQVTMMLP
jgi:carbonic anhydrase